MATKKIITLDNLEVFKANADIVYQPKESKLTSISGLSNSSTGLVKLTNGVASLDSSAYATQSYVDTAISNLPEPMVFKGTLGTGGTITSLPTAAAGNEGWTYKVITDGTYGGQAAKVGDVFVCAKIGSTYSWIYIPAGDDVEDTWRGISVNGTSLLGNAISTGGVNFKSGGGLTFTGSGNDITIGVNTQTHFLPTIVEKTYWNAKQDALSTQNAYSAVGSATAIPVITTNTLGQVTNIDTVAVSIPSVDQTYNASSTNAQSGTAVAGAIANMAVKNADNNFSTIQTFSSNGIKFENGGNYASIVFKGHDQAGPFLTINSGDGWGVEVNGRLYCSGAVSCTSILPSEIGDSFSAGTIYEWQNTYKTRKEVDSSTVSASYGVKFPDTTGYSANKTLATTDQIPTTTSSVISGSTAVITSGGVFTALGLLTGETGLQEATTSEINALFS